MKVSRYGHLRSAPVVVDVGVRTEWEPPTLRAALCCLHVPSLAPPRWLPASPLTGNQCVAVARVKVQNFARDAECYYRSRVRVQKFTRKQQRAARFSSKCRFPLGFAPSRAVHVTAPPCFTRGPGRPSVPKEPDRLFSTTSRICKNAHFLAAGLDGNLTVSRPWRHPKSGFSCLLSAHSRC